MIWVAVYLYVVGATLMWWWARAQRTQPSAAKVLVAVLWPIMVPVVALWA